MKPGIRIWVDDERDPSHPFIQNNFGAVGDELWVTTAPETIKLLKQGNVISVSLDHDLGLDPGIGSGYDIALWIEENAFYDTLEPIEWYVHSVNPIGKRKMTLALQNADKFWYKNKKIDDNYNLP